MILCITKWKPKGVSQMAMGFVLMGFAIAAPLLALVADVIIAPCLPAKEN